MTGCDRILARLTEGPATAAELYATTYCVVHSRVAELRRRGHRIECERVDGEGAAGYVYRLLGEEGTGIESGAPDGPLLPEQVLPPEGAPATSRPLGPAGAQLSIEVAA